MEPIEKLLEKYWQAETSLEEERYLKGFFSGNEIPASLETYRMYFQNIASFKKVHIKDAEKFEKDFEKNIQPRLGTKLFTSKTLDWALKIAAVLLIFFTGFWIGGNQYNNTPQITQLQTELQDLREAVVMAQLKQNSASERLKGVNFVSEEKIQSPETIQALIETLNNDESPNVRLAALNVLLTFKDSHNIRQALIASLSQQHDPSVKIALINAMLLLKERQAKPFIEDFLQQEPLPPTVKQVIQEELKKM